jgi:hypothetical protein
VASKEDPNQGSVGNLVPGLRQDPSLLTVPITAWRETLPKEAHIWRVLRWWGANTELKLPLRAWGFHRH